MTILQVSLKGSSPRRHTAPEFGEEVHQKITLHHEKSRHEFHPVPEVFSCSFSL
jgi:hypothetical protein